jgi:hypothetical protein
MEDNVKPTTKGGVVSFRTVAVITAIVIFALGVGYLFAGALVMSRWQIQSTDGVLLLGRRMGGLYLGLSVTYFLARSAPVSIARTALSAGSAVALSLVALLGVYEFTAGHAGLGILVSVVIESVLALGYVRILFTERRVAVAG